MLIDVLYGIYDSAKSFDSYIIVAVIFDIDTMVYSTVNFCVKY